MRTRISFLAVRFLLATALIFTISGFAHAVVHDGQIDPTFNVRPFVINAGTVRIDCFATLPDGKILVGGALSNLSGGDTNGVGRLNPDGSFDNSFRGRSTARINEIFPLADGKILITGDFLQYDGITRNRIARLNPDGSLDTTFAPNFGTEYVQIVAVQPDGKIIVVGIFTTVNGVSRNRVARLHPDGSLDLTFVVGNGLDNSGVYRAAVQPDGKIVFAGRFTSYNGVPRNGVLRLNTDGSLDTDFVPNIPGSSNEIFDMSLASDGTIYVVGDIANVDRIYRLTSAGLIDTTFNIGNTETASGRIYSVVAQPDGKVIVGGDFDGFRVNGNIQIRYGLFRFNSNGSVDSTFVGQAPSTLGVRALEMYGDKILVGGDFAELNGTRRGGIGRLNLDSTLDQSFVGFLGSRSFVTAFHIYPDGKMLVVGSFDLIGTSFRRYVAKLHADGSVDASFQVDPGVTHQIFAVSVQPDGKIILGGYTGDNGFGGVLGKGVWRINSNGTLDPTFNTQVERLESVGSIDIQPDGKILIAGGFSKINGVSRRALARLNSDGTLDASFNPVVGGLSLSTVKLQPDGKILIGGGFTTINGSPIANFARLNADGTVDTSFNIGPGASNAVSAFFILPDNRIYVGGSYSSITGVSRTGLVRLHPNGTLDTTFKPVRISSSVYSILGVANDKVLVGGTTSSIIDAAPRRAVIRFLSDGTLDFSFDVSGATRNGSNGDVYQLGAHPDGKIIVAGQFDGLNGVSVGGFARLLTFENPTLPLWDFDGDGKTDISVFRPGTNVWHQLRSSFGIYRAFQWGSSGDTLVPADFDGDFRTDIAVFRPSNGGWYILNSSDNTTVIAAFGASGDLAAPADFDGDGRADLAVFRPADGNWWLNRSSAGVTAVQFGSAGDRPIPADYDGDRKADIAIFRPAATGAEWWINRSAGGVTAMQFGASTDRAVQGDYTGDGKTDIAIWRPSSGEWFIVRSEDFSFYGFPFGTNGDLPASGDYDGDGKFDPTVFRPSSATWFIARTTAGTQIVQFGAAGDRPIPNAFVP